MEPERQETYERIPWETLEKRRGDNQWVVYAIAAAVVLGALAYSFMRNQPPPAPASGTPAATPTTVPETTPASVVSTPSTVASPVVVAEADLYAVDPERLIDRVTGHAEWFAVEYMAIDGSEQSREVLASLLPGGVPVPEAAEAVQVFVDWVGTRAVNQTGPVSFEVEVLVRSLVSTGEGGFVRQPPALLRVPVEVGEDGAPRVASVPALDVVPLGTPADLTLSQPPEEVVEGVADEVVGGIQRSDGGWDLVVMTVGDDGVRRPVVISR